MLNNCRKKQDFRKKKPQPLYERPDAVAHFPFCDDGHVNDVFRFDTTKSQAFVNMGLSARKRLVQKTFQELCMGSSNSRDYITRMKISDVPMALHTLGISITSGLKEAFKSIKGAVDEGTKTREILPTVTEGEFQLIVQRFVFAEQVRRKHANQREPSKLEVQLKANEPPAVSSNISEVEKFLWLREPIDFEGWMRAMDEIEPLGMGDTPVPSTDKEAVEKLLADVRAHKKKKVARKISTEKENMVKAKAAYVPKSAQTIRIEKKPVLDRFANVPSKLKETIDADKAIYRKNREAEKNAAIMTIAKHKVKKIMLQSKFQPSEEFLVRERQTRSGTLTPTSARRAREGRDIINPASLWKFTDDYEIKATSSALSQESDGLSFDEYLAGKVVPNSADEIEADADKTFPSSSSSSSSRKDASGDPLLIADSFLEGNVAKKMDVKAVINRYNDNYVEPYKRDETLHLVPRWSADFDVVPSANRSLSPRSRGHKPVTSWRSPG